MLNVSNVASAKNGTRFEIVAIEGDSVFARIQDCPKSPLYIWGVDGASKSLNDSYDIPLLPYMDLSDVIDLEKAEHSMIFRAENNSEYRFIAQDNDNLYLAHAGYKGAPAYVWNLAGFPVSFGSAMEYRLTSLNLDGEVYAFGRDAEQALIELGADTDMDEDDDLFRGDDMVEGFGDADYSDYFNVTADDFQDVMMNRDALYHTMNTVIGAGGNIDTQAAVVMVLNAIQKDLSR